MGLEPAMSGQWPHLGSPLGPEPDGVGEVADHAHVHGQFHRMPAPRLSAIVARSAMAVVKRARFAFTLFPR